MSGWACATTLASTDASSAASEVPRCPRVSSRSEKMETASLSAPGDTAEWTLYAASWAACVVTVKATAWGDTLGPRSAASSWSSRMRTSSAPPSEPSWAARSTRKSRLTSADFSCVAAAMASAHVARTWGTVASSSNVTRTVRTAGSVAVRIPWGVVNTPALKSCRSVYRRRRSTTEASARASEASDADSSLWAMLAMADPAPRVSLSDPAHAVTPGLLPAVVARRLAGAMVRQLVRCVELA
mmetsp:Transcript_15415/g.37901  ORF Transcript_15415/g.37901 Transcript_15415/m.37901 type:complete len:242 (-) Transcript_15415:104-829(-)